MEREKAVYFLQVVGSMFAKELGCTHVKYNSYADNRLVFGDAFRKLLKDEKNDVCFLVL